MARSIRAASAPLVILLAVSLGLLLAAAVVSQEAGPPAEPRSREHDLLQQDVGAWEGKLSIWTSPDAEPIVSDATETNELLKGGMWLLSRFEGSIGELKFSGRGMFGYDPSERKHVGTWIDSMSPYLMVMKGDYDAETRTLTMIGQGRSAETGEVITSRHVSQYHDDGTRTFAMYMPGPGGEWWKMLQIDYRRQAPGMPRPAR